MLNGNEEQSTKNREVAAAAAAAAAVVEDVAETGAIGQRQVGDGGGLPS